MNYGKKNLSKRKNQISSKKRMKTKRVGVRFFKALILCILLLAVICVIGGVILIKHIIDNTPNVTAEDILLRSSTRTVQRLRRSKIPTPTVYTKHMMRFLNIWLMLLSPLRTSVFMSTME